MLVSFIFVIFIFLSMIAVIVIKGLPGLNWKMLTQTPKSGYYIGGEGGILNAILGSLYLAVGATLLAALISVPVVLFINVYLKKDSWFAMLVRFSFDVLWGIPSIVYGAFGFAVMIFFHVRASLLGAIITVAILEFPIISRVADGILKLVPVELKEVSLSLGATRFETSFKVILKQAAPGILTALLIGFGRGVSDAASVLFTAGYTDSLPTSLLRPVATLPLAIFFQLGTPFAEVQQRGYTAALILILIIFAISGLSRILSKRFHEHILR
ncbi:MAG: ABC transporter permease subunit [Candidatus Omnitrophica bacterium]|nr:ABC transporter permease subunit [Candidatus Omnitrophota bacterium]